VVRRFCCVILIPIHLRLLLPFGEEDRQEDILRTRPPRAAGCPFLDLYELFFRGSIQVDRQDAISRGAKGYFTPKDIPKRCFLYFY
jgi:hypothetical protein